MLYRLSLLTSNTTSATNNGATWSYMADAANTPRIRSITLNQAAATDSDFGLGISGTAGTQSGAVAPLAIQSGAAAAVGTCATTWSVAPAAAANYFERITFPATKGATRIIDFPGDGLTLAAGEELVLFCLETTCSALNVTIEVEE